MNIEEHEADIAQDDLMRLYHFKERLIHLISDIQTHYKNNGVSLSKDFEHEAIAMEESLDEILFSEVSRLQEISGSLETYPRSQIYVNWLASKNRQYQTELQIVEQNKFAADSVL